MLISRLIFLHVKNSVDADQIKLFVCIAVILVGAAFAFPFSFIAKSNLFIGIILFPAVLFCSAEQRFNIAYFGMLILFSTLAFYYDLRIFYFFALSFFILLLVGLFIGRMNYLALFLIAFMSPAFQHLALIIGFPIRLELSNLAGKVLTLFGEPVSVEGNLIVLKSSSFYVDDACMGLNMLVFSMLIGVAGLAFHYRRHKKRISFVSLMAFFAGVFALNIFCNLMRILVLVIFRIAAEDPMHELAGLCCFIAYIMIPVYFLSQWFTRRGHSLYSGTPVRKVRSFTKWSTIPLAFVICVIGVRLNINRNIEPQLNYTNVTIPGLHAIKLKSGVTKFYNDRMLVYVKPIPEFFTGEHTPLYCWKGSGYKFESIQRTKVHGHEIYTGQLVKQGRKLHTAWWYGNSTTLTIDQLDWRMRMLKGEEKFALINVTAADERVLNEELADLLTLKFK